MGSIGTLAPLQNIILVGPGGSLGTVLLKGLLSEPAFTVAVLVRESSKAISSLPPNIAHVYRVSDDYPYDKLVEAFRGQDAVVNCITGTEVEEQFKFIDAAVEAGVKRYVPSEYGLNNSRPEARALSSVFDAKGKVREYLRSKESTGLTWHAIACGMWIDWSFKNNFMGLDYPNRTMTFADNGKGKTSTSTMANTALAVNRALLNPHLTANQCVYISDFATSQSELIDMIEKVSGERWTVNREDSERALVEAKARVEAGDLFAVYKLIELGFVTGRYGGWLEEKEEIWNERLGLPKANLEGVVRDALEKMQV